MSKLCKFLKSLFRPCSYDNIDEDTIIHDEKKQEYYDISNENECMISTFKIVPSIFKGRYCMGDFKWEIDNRLSPKTLYIFNDNEDDHNSDVMGGGNAVIRVYNIYGYNNVGMSYPCAAGICTGKNYRGYKEFTKEVKQTIDSNIEEIKTILKLGHYTSIKYSAANEDGDLGTGIFNVNEQVKEYIVKKINELEKIVL